MTFEDGKKEKQSISELLSLEVQPSDQISNTLLKDIDTLVNLYSFLKANPD